jgi:sirohydrochlorin ferrochelatase
MHALTEQAIDQALNDIEAQHAGNRPVILRHILTRLAQQAESAGRDDALLSLRTTQQAADELGIGRLRVQRIAREMDLGWDSGRDIILTPDDIEVMRQRNTAPGRPRKTTPA